MTIRNLDNGCNLRVSNTDNVPICSQTLPNLQKTDLSVNYDPDVQHDDMGSDQTQSSLTDVLTQRLGQADLTFCVNNHRIPLTLYFKVTETELAQLQTTTDANLMDNLPARIRSILLQSFLSPI